MRRPLFGRSALAGGRERGAVDHRGEKIQPLIIVGIDNTRNRAREYIPYRSRDPRVFNPKGSAIPDFLRREVMPLIEERYRYLKGPEIRDWVAPLWEADRAVRATGSARSIWASADRESVSVVGDRKILEESRRFRAWPARTYLGMGDAGSRAARERRKDGWRRSRTGKHSPRGGPG